MPSRILREGINSSRRINTLSFGAEILYRRMISVVDDYGRYYASPATLRGACWPTSPEKVKDGQILEWLKELSSGTRPLVTFYEVDSCSYLQLTDFNQKIRSKSKFPSPPENLPADCLQHVDNLQTDCGQVVDNLPQNVSTMRSSNCVVRSSNAEANKDSSSAAAEDQLKAIGWLGVSGTSDEVCELIMKRKIEEFPESKNLDSPFMVYCRLNWFSEFWSFYWRHDDKKTARIAYFRAVQSAATKAAVEDAVLAQSVEMSAREKKYQPLAATWLNKERWLNAAPLLDDAA